MSKKNCQSLTLLSWWVAGLFRNAPWLSSQVRTGGPRIISQSKSNVILVTTSSSSATNKRKVFHGQRQSVLCWNGKISILGPLHVGIEEWARKTLSLR